MLALVQVSEARIRLSTPIRPGWLLLGKPGRIASLQRFLDHVQAHADVWICRRIDIARHWKAVHPYPTTKA